MIKWVNEQVFEWVSEWASDRVSEWARERVTLWPSSDQKTLYTHIHIVSPLKYWNSMTRWRSEDQRRWILVWVLGFNSLLKEINQHGDQRAVYGRKKEATGVLSIIHGTRRWGKTASADDRNTVKKNTQKNTQWHHQQPPQEEVKTPPASVGEQKPVRLKKNLDQEDRKVDVWGKRKDLQNTRAPGWRTVEVESWLLLERSRSSLLMMELVTEQQNKLQTPTETFYWRFTEKCVRSNREELHPAARHQRARTPRRASSEGKRGGF